MTRAEELAEAIVTLAEVHNPDGDGLGVLAKRIYHAFAESPDDWELPYTELARRLSVALADTSHPAPVEPATAEGVRK